VWALYLPLLIPALALVAARPLADRLEPRLATWLLTATTVALAAFSTAALALLAASALARVPALAELGDEPHATRIAAAIVTARSREPSRQTEQLARLIQQTVGITVVCETHALSHNRFTVCLAEGVYDVFADAVAFKPAKRKSIKVDPRGKSIVDFVLKRGKSVIVDESHP